ncbi:outer membrane beta-barrel protein [uncultured Formosa sp.]|uniref:outer membrane beta-barrel protein n=1 Tax=uncultured Formosa sp. TaxID=255435 RepID=UPI00260DA313|nr:outer membrane beta-barrel protein [uncultured Formosa sp.]
MKYIFILFFFLITTFSYTQSKKFEISGTLIAGDINEPLEAATVYLQRIQDSSLVAYGITNQKGEFNIEGKTPDEQLNIFMSYLGYKTYAKVIDMTSDEIQLPALLLEIEDNTLDEVLIKSTAPVTFKTDTLEYNVKSFKTKQDANVEDVLKILPGVEIDEDGVITVNGVTVDNILVNGNSFFGDDPTIATRNLTKDIIKKIQIVDTKTKDQAFAGEAGDQENKTINLTIEEDKNRGQFGRVSAAGGTDDRYEMSGIYNRFNDTRRISILAGGNNINAPGFSNSELNDTFGRGGSREYSGNGDGIITSKNVGANYTDAPSRAKEFSTDYFYARSDSDQNQKTNKEIFLPDSKYYTAEESSDFKTNQSHKANLSFETQLDSTFMISFRPKFEANKNDSKWFNEAQSFDADRSLTNQSVSQISSTSVSQEFSANVRATKRIGTKGSFLRLSMGGEMNHNDSDKYAMSETNYYGDNPSEEIRNQYENGAQNETQINSSLRFRLPLIEKKLMFDVNYDYRSVLSKSKLSTFDYNEGDSAYSNFNLDQSTDFDNDNVISSPELGFRYNGNKWYFNTEAGYDIIELSSKDALRPELNFNQDFTKLKMSTTFGYRIKSKLSARFQYRLRNEAPSISQLQPYTDISNPLHIVKGNPALEMTQNHRMQVRFNTNNYNKQFGFFGYANLSILDNDVVSQSVIDENLVKTTTYINVDGSYSLNVRLNVSKKLKLDSISTLKFVAGLGPNLQRKVNFNNALQYTSTVQAMSPSLGVVYEIPDFIEVETRYSAQFSKGTYSIESFDDTEYTTHNLRLNTATYFLKGFEWRNNLNFNYNSNISDDFQKSSWFLNSTISYSVLNKNGYITLKAYDILNQNTNARRVVNQDYIEDSSSNVLQQYFMLGFSWKFNSLGS